jgi:hypothetical protein
MVPVVRTRVRTTLAVRGSLRAAAVTAVFPTAVRVHGACAPGRLGGRWRAMERSAFGPRHERALFRATPRGPALLVGGESLGRSGPRGTSVARWRRARSVLGRRSREFTDSQLISSVGVTVVELADPLSPGGLRSVGVGVARGSTHTSHTAPAAGLATGSWVARTGRSARGRFVLAEPAAVMCRLALVPRPGAEPGAVVAAQPGGIDLAAVATGEVVPFRLRGVRPVLRLPARARCRGTMPCSRRIPCSRRHLTTAR